MTRFLDALDKAWVAALCGVLLPVGVAAILVPFRGNFSLPASALVLVLVVVGVGSFGSRFAGFLAALSSAAWFDFFLTKPYETFNIAYRTDLETELSLLVVGLAITEISARSRGHRKEASEEADNIALIHDFTEMVSSGAPAESVISHATTELGSLLKLRDCHFETQMSDRHPTRIEHSGVVALGGLHWGAHRSGLPGREVELLVEYRGHSFGRFVMAPTPGEPVAADRLLVAAFIADQVGAALAVQARSA
jgi:K+-sensing histidine kinase KdpD